VIRGAASVVRAMREAPIGVFDSGVGGLSVLAEIQRLLPNESLLYVADCGHIPYGEKTPEFIRQRCSVMAGFFHEQGAKALVLACNTATVAGVADLRRDFPDWPIVGMEPAVKPAAAATRSGVVGVLATTGTLQSAKFAALLDRFAADVRVITQPCPGLVELIESGDLHSTELRQLLHGYVEPLLTSGCDTIILGCTHLSFSQADAQVDDPCGHQPDRYRRGCGASTSAAFGGARFTRCRPEPAGQILVQRRSCVLEKHLAAAGTKRWRSAKLQLVKKL
jgi:glutamate racemase